MNYSFAIKQTDFTANVIKDVNCSLHIHRQFEIVLVIENSLTMQINLDTHNIPCGTAVLVDPYEPHSFMTLESNRCLIIEFSPDFYPPFADWLNTHSVIRRDIIIPQKTFEYIMTVLPNTVCTDDGFKAYSLLAPLCRAIIENGEWKKEKKRFDDSFLNALDIISNEYSQPLTRDYVSQKLGICPQTLSRIFKKNSKIDFVNYVQYIRVFHSIVLIENGESITDAAYLSGFESVRTFNRVFKSIIGMTPSEYISSENNTPIDFYATANY